MLQSDQWTTAKLFMHQQTMAVSPLTATETSSEGRTLLEDEMRMTLGSNLGLRCQKRRQNLVSVCNFRDQGHRQIKEKQTRLEGEQG